MPLDCAIKHHNNRNVLHVWLTNKLLKQKEIEKRDENHTNNIILDTLLIKEITKLEQE